jgi:quinoprotein glucose dehydrogenase
MNSNTLLLALCAAIATLALPQTTRAADAADLASKFKKLPTVPEAELPALSNQLGPFRGAIQHPGFEGHTWVTFPFVENAASLDIDPLGRVFVSEANRFWLGVPDLRGANEMIRDDFKAATIADRLALYEKFKTHFPEGWFNTVADRVIRLEDQDRNGAPDHRTLFSDHFKAAEDGIGFSLLAERDAVYFTCLPKLWKMTDANGDGRADTHDAIAGDFGVRISFIGHDLHGIVRGPDGRLYFSVGDRGYHVKTADGQTHLSEGRGGVFRCESDGSGLELYADGLRNPQELGFDDHGNLFTFDNTGDIGDKARMVYVLENTDSGWNMAHQSPHQYAKALDWGDFRPAKAVWVAERMYDLWNADQPQWVYPPIAHVGNGPSGFTFLTGDALPDDLRGRFLLTNYSGAATASNSFLVSFTPAGAGFKTTAVTELVKGIAAADVALGYDGRLFFADFGGGWSINTNASIQVLTPTDAKLRENGQAAAKLIATGFSALPEPQLESLLHHPDQRLRREAQFELVRQTKTELLNRIAQIDPDRLARLHALWGLGQLKAAAPLILLTSDPDPEIRANAARTLGDLRAPTARTALLPLLRDTSPRVRALAAIALGRVCSPGDTEAIDALFTAHTDPIDVVLRHAQLSALDRIATETVAAAKATSPDREQRLLAVLFLRRHQSPQLAAFLSDTDAQIRHETLRAIYDTAALDSPAGTALAALDPTDLPEPLQRRLIAANYRLGTPDHARRLLELAAHPALTPAARRFALHGLEKWTAAIETDPILGHYRPQKVTQRDPAALTTALAKQLPTFLSTTQEPQLITLGTQLASQLSITLDETSLRRQVTLTTLDPTIRVASLDMLIKLAKPADDALLTTLLTDPAPTVQAAALGHAFSRKLKDLPTFAREQIATGPLPTARAAIAGLPTDTLATLWTDRTTQVRPALWLDLYTRLQTADHPTLKTFTDLPQTLTEFGGSVTQGEQVFRNQGACMQCHLMSGSGGIQGPDLTTVADRLPTAKLLESLIHPNAVIAEGYGMSSVTLKDGTALVGRLAKETPAQITLLAADGKETQLDRSAIASLTPPISAMPPMALTLPLQDLRDLMAYLATRTQKNAKGKTKDTNSHGDKAQEKIAK